MIIDWSYFLPRDLRGFTIPIRTKTVTLPFHFIQLLSAFQFNGYPRFSNDFFSNLIIAPPWERLIRFIVADEPVMPSEQADVGKLEEPELIDN